MPTHNPPPERTIIFYWACGMGERCTNAMRPGSHGGDDGHADAGACRGIPRPKRATLKAPVLVFGRSIPILAGAA